MSLFKALLALNYLLIRSQAQTSHSATVTGADCAFFVTESTPMPLYLCMQWQYNTKSYMYKCENDIISMVHWNNPVCSGIINQTFYLNESVVSDIHNCNAPQISQSFDNYKECNLASLSIWNNGYCQSSPAFQLLYVIDVCININNQYSVNFGCDNDKGLIKQDVYQNNIHCLGTPLNDSGSDSSMLDPADSNNGNDMCFKMRCNNKTYVSYDGAPTTNIGTSSFWNSADSEEILFIIAAGSALVIFWGCYCYRKCCRVSKEQIDAEINNEENHKQNPEKYDELVEDEMEDEDENKIDGDGDNEDNDGMKSIQKNDGENLNNGGDNKSTKLLGDADME